MSASLQEHKLSHHVDEHVFIVLKCEERPTLSIDIANMHGRRGMNIRLNGMGVFSMLIDLETLGPKTERFARFCPFCGEEHNLVSSKTHHCDE